MRLQEFSDKSKLVRATLELIRWDAPDEQNQAHEVFGVLDRHRDSLVGLLAAHGVSWIKHPGVMWPRGRGALTEEQGRILTELLMEVEAQEAELDRLFHRGAA